MLGLIYIFVAAKPISVRRLSLLFFATLLFASTFLGALPVKHRPNEALIAASSLTLLAWSLPLIRVVCRTIWHGELSLTALTPVSSVVRCTYGLGLAALLLAAVGEAFSPTRHLTLGAFLHLITAAIPIGFACYVGKGTATQGSC